MVWNAIERFGASLFLFISNLVLARLLSPDDFGCIAMLLVFISVSDAIIDGGFGSALIQKKTLLQRITPRYSIGICFCHSSCMPYCIYVLPQ